MDGRDECRKRINTKKYYIIFCDVLKLDLTNHKEKRRRGAVTGWLGVAQGPLQQARHPREQIDYQ